MMMSESLKGVLPGEGEDDFIAAAQEQYVHVIADRRIAGQQLPIAGLLRTVLFDEKPEIEFKVALVDALETVKAEELPAE